MKVTLRSVLIVFALVSLPLWAQPARTTRPAQTRQQQRDQSTTTPPQVARGVQPHDTWYEFLLKQFNPGQLDYGTWIEQRRRHFLESTLRNPYFNYSCLATMGLLALAVAYTKKWIDHRRVLLVTSEMMADFYNHDQHSRNATREAIRRFNSHMEICNRRAEAEYRDNTAGASITGTDNNGLAAELQRVAGELSTVQQEKSGLEATVQSQANVITELSLRVETLTKRNGKDNGPQPITTVNDPGLIKHINDLQCQLHEERQKNRRLKGG